MRCSINVRITDSRSNDEHETSLIQGSTEVRVEMLLAQLQELLGVIRGNATQVNVQLTAAASDPGLLKTLVRRCIQKEPEHTGSVLSKRELEVLDLIMKGLTNKDIAERLFVSFETVKCHRRHILEKTGTRNTAALVSHFHNIFRDRG